MRQTQMYVPPLSKINKYIIIAHVGLFLLNSILKVSAGTSLVSIFGLSLAGMSQGLVYQVLTFPFIEVNFLSALFNSMLIWFIGGDLELKWGSSFYAKFLALSVVASGLVYLIVSLVAGANFHAIPLHGLGGAVFALLMAYGIIFSERLLTFMLLFPMKAKYFCMILAAIELYVGLFSTYGKASWAHLSAAAIGYGFLKWKSMKAQGQSLGGMWNESAKKRRKNKFKIVKDEQGREGADPKDPKFWQ